MRLAAGQQPRGLTQQARRVSPKAIGAVGCSSQACSRKQALGFASCRAGLPALRICSRPARTQQKALCQATPEQPSSGPSSSSSNSSEAKPGFFGSLYRSLRDFGIGRRSLAEGSVGLFVALGGALAVALVMWARGSAMRKGSPYQATFEFPLACGITIGTPVRIRGVPVGTVLNVKPSLDRVDVLVEINDAGTVIPRSSVVEANQSGLIAEPLVDITPQLPIQQHNAGPLDPRCEDEAVVVCNNGHIRGQQGVALDDLVYIMTRLSRQMEQEGIDKIFAAAEAATAAIKDAQPLLQQATSLVEEVTPLLQELRDGGLVSNLEHLTQAAAGAAADIQKLQGAVLTEDNVKALRLSVLTLCRTLEHIESISSDVAVFSQDASVQRNLKTLIQALSRLVEE